MPQRQRQNLAHKGLGIALLERIDNSDPSALVGLPLIETARMLRAAGIPILGSV